jgi:hypothetical protein
MSRTRKVKATSETSGVEEIPDVQEGASSQESPPSESQPTDSEADRVDETPQEETLEEAPPPPVRKRRDLGGTYLAKYRLTLDDGRTIEPGKEVTFSDEEARHYIKFDALIPTD